MNFMSIRQWGRDGEWSTNYSAIAMSHDNGQNWGIYPGTIRTASADAIPGVPFTPGNENFQMGAFMKGNDGYLYRSGLRPDAAVRRFCREFPRINVPDLTKYQYWNGDNGGRWVPSNPGAATPVFPGPVGEMSAQYNSYLKQYLVLYTRVRPRRPSRPGPLRQQPAAEGAAVRAVRAFSDEQKTWSTRSPAAGPSRSPCWRHNRRYTGADLNPAALAYTAARLLDEHAWPAAAQPGLFPFPA